MPKLKRKGIKLRAVYANRGVEAWYRARLQCVMREMAQSMLVHIRAAYNNSDNPLASDAPNSTYLLRKALEKWGGLWTRKLNKMSLDLADQFAKRAGKITENQVGQAFREAGFTVKFRPTEASVAAYKTIAAEQVGLIRSIPQQYLTAVQTKVFTSVMKGADMATLTAELQQAYGVSHRRAALIARDQNHKAKAVIENTRRQELGITQAIWQHSGAGKEPRPEHVAFNGKVFDLAKGAYLEGKWTLPGMEINCRCTSRAIIPGFD